jgi:uncharacterized protein (DUF1499 family)
LKTLLKQLLVFGLILGGFYAFTAWPRLQEVETGKTPEYPDIRPHDYGFDPVSVAKGVRKVMDELPRWQVTGEAKGPAGIDLQGVHASPFGLVKEDVTVKVRREKGRTVVSVHSKSRLSFGDFGQNARNIRELLYALDREVF